MKPERWHEVDKILQSVLERDPTERGAYLDEVCAGDEQLRRAVLTVMGSHEQAGTFMTSPRLQVSGDDLADGSKLKPGDAIGLYRIRKPIGRGGMGEVYLAEHTTLSREVALKILPEHFLNDVQRVQRFRQEARAVLALNHPNVVTVYDIGEAEGVHFISTEFVEGQTLRERMTHARLTISEAIEIAAQVAGAIAYAHEKGVIHRDIKPENIMLRPDGYVKVLDFGIAKLTERQAASTTDPNEAQTWMKVETSPGMVMGTAHYMSPEQARGKKVDERTDTWSLGAVLYEMLTGRPPFEGETPSDIIGLILQRDPAPLTALAPEAPPELERIVSKALDKSQDERYQTAKDFLADLRRFKRHYEQEADIERSTPPGAIRGTKASTGGQRTSSGAAESAASSAVTGQATSSAEYIVAGIRHHKLITFIALAVLALGIVGFNAYWNAKNTEVAIESIAVLPFTYENQNPDSEYLSDGVTESIINSLAQLPNLKVIARSSAFRYKGRQVDPLAAGKELGVRAVLTGRVVQRGDNLTISAELIEVRENKQLWGEQYDRKVSDILVLQKQIANQISEKLRLRLTGEDHKLVAKSYTENVEAYQLYLKGRYYWGKRTEDGTKKSIDYFNQAIEADPNYALAYSGLADGYVVLSLFYVLPPKEAFAKAKSAAMRALEIDDKLAEAHASLSLVRLFYEWDWSSYESDANRAIQLNPNYATVHYEYAQELAAVGRFDEAIKEAKRAQELDPLAAEINTTAAWVFYLVRNYDEAIKQYRAVIETNPTYFRSHRLLGTSYLQKKQPEEAVAEIQKAVALSGDSAEEIAYLGYAYAASGQRAEAERVINKLQEQAKHRYVSPYLLALIYVGLDEKDQAFAWLEKAYEDRSVNLIWLKVEPIFDRLRPDRRFADLVCRVGT